MTLERYIGLMSGTSLDGVDAALVEFSSDSEFNVKSTLFTPYPAQLKQDLFQLFTPGPGEIDQMGRQCQLLGALFAKTVSQLLYQSDLAAEDICAIGCHGQTIRHRPNSNQPFTLQIGDPNIIAHLTGITTIADFRRRDMAAGGQGAPLAPAFHHKVFHHPTENRVIINIGGIANITWIPSDTDTACIGFDTGPGNGLMDAWCKKYTGADFDQQGRWAQSGKVVNELLESLLAYHYFESPPPKSTGKEEFNEQWLEAFLAPHSVQNPQDIQATLLQLTVSNIQSAIQAHCPNAQAIYVCGGGALNAHLMAQIEQACRLPTKSTQALGTSPDWVEAITFAWLARQTRHSLTGNLPDVTGAKENVILGGIYPGKNGFY